MDVIARLSSGEDGVNGLAQLGKATLWTHALESIDAILTHEKERACDLNDGIMGDAAHATVELPEDPVHLTGLITARTHKGVDVLIGENNELLHKGVKAGYCFSVAHPKDVVGANAKWVIRVTQDKPLWPHGVTGSSNQIQRVHIKEVFIISQHGG